MLPIYASSNFLSSRPLEMPYFPFYPFFYHNDVDFYFYGWKNGHYTQGFSNIKPEPATQIIDKPQDSNMKPQFNLSLGLDAGTKKVQDKGCRNLKIPKRQQRKFLAEGLENRNIIPNIACNILSFLRRINRSGKIVDKIINTAKGSEEGTVSAKKFYAYQHFLKENLTDFKGKDVIEVLISAIDNDCRCFTISQQMYYNKVSRILIKHYLESNFLVDILSSNRVSKTNRRDYLKGRRIMIDLLAGIKQYEPQIHQIK